MPTPSSSEGGGNTTAQVVASGKVLPAANPTGVTIDATTYGDPIAGGGAKLTTLVFPSNAGALAIAISGDDFPRYILAASPVSDGLYMGNGTAAPTSTGAEVYVTGAGQLNLASAGGGAGAFVNLLNPVHLLAGSTTDSAPRINQLSPLFTITSGALPTVALVSGAGAQISTSRDAETVTPFTGDGTNNAATCAIALSPDNVTYSTLATISIAAALNLTGVLTDTVNCRVPAGWYLKLTASHGTIGTTTYY